MMLGIRTMISGSFRTEAILGFLRFLTVFFWYFEALGPESALNLP